MIPLVRRLCVRVAIAALVALAAACQSTPDPIPPGLSPQEMFQRAQNSVDDQRWEQALAYYNEFKTRFPDDPGPLAEADYEIAFIAYKQGDLTSARAQFVALLDLYEREQAGQPGNYRLPLWPQVLSQRLIEIIDDRMAEEGLLDIGNGG